MQKLNLKAISQKQKNSQSYRSLNISCNSYGNLSPIKAGGFDSPIKTGFEIDSGSPSTAAYDNDLTFTEAANSAEKKYDVMFQKKLEFESIDKANRTPPVHLKGNRSLVIQKNNCSVIDPLLQGLENDEFLTFEEKYNIDHKSILGEGASSQVKRCMFKKRVVFSNQDNIITKHLTPAQEKDEILDQSDCSVDSDSDSDSESKSMSIESDCSDVEINNDEDVNEDENLAVKIVRSRCNEITEMAYDEFKLLKTLDHPNIVKMHDAFYNESKQTMYLVMDQIKGKSLGSTQNLALDQIKEVTRQLLESIDYLHSNSICHRDVNPNNIIISKDSDNKIKSTLIDFNVSKRFNSTKFFNPILMMTNTGTPMYQAPEMVEGAVSYYDEKIDLWSVGAILYFMITGKHAFQQETCEKIEEAISNVDFDQNHMSYVTLDNNVKNLVSGLLQKDISLRLSASEALKMEWFQL